MRRVFLWAARNRWLKERLPRLPFMSRAVRRFMPGETLEDALAAALPLQAAGIGTMYTRLGENLERTPSDVMVDQRPVLDLKGRELTLSIDSRGDQDSLFYLDDLTLAVNPEPKAN